ncbi:hypothetical protein SUGI_0991250 [Cryptomeria japonica]|uniref:DNA repair endonuclease UVH1 n=1 Tax=Cryptomeria japonica TaxID=3369 RepID=UPI002414987B|nr:DNA repair endonuclease UVH1 [Cryptomeria japonica]GLJ46967.1 hypothetical protein SUGI_0991250 [Cryptomeria japonica]
MRLFQNQSSLPMLPFHEHIIGELLQDDNGGLVVLGSGLGLHKLIASLIRLHSHSDGLLFILSTSDSQRRALTEDLRLAAPIDIDSQYTSQDRVEFYSQGGVFFITSRILVVDLLNEKVPLSRVAGLIIVNAHRLTETCTEAFIVRLYRFGNRKGYVRAFSDRPQSMVAGFSKTERIMKCLFVRKLHLWPRFQVFVSDILEKDPPEVIDVRMPHTSLMSGIQSAIIEVMDACLKELRKTNKVDVEDLTVESGLFKSFDEIVRQQLDPIWHIIGKKTKQLVRDLKTLRKLADYLVRYDAVTYLKYLDALRVSEGVRSVWIFANPSHRIFELAKKRVYQVVRSDGGKIGSANGLIKGVSRVRGDASKRRKINVNDIKENKGAEASTLDRNGETSNDLSKEALGVELEVVGEEMPKWKVLREVLEEIEEERKKRKVCEEGLDSSQDAWDDGGGTVLVACKDERSCMQLQDCIYKGPQKLMREEWEKYLLGKSELHGLRTHKKKKNQGLKGFGILDGNIPAGFGDNSESGSTYRLEQDALLAAAAQVAVHDKEVIPVGDDLSLGKGVKGQGRGRGRGRGGRGGRGRGKGRGKKDTTVGVHASIMKYQGKQERNKAEMSKESELADTTSTTGTLESKGASSECVQNIDEVAFDDSTENVNAKRTGKDCDDPEINFAKPVPIAHYYALENDRLILDIVKPSYIVVYDPNMGFVREIEVYKAENPGKPLKVYFLFYENSTEEQKFEASIRRENNAFESLIRQKSMMMIPVDQDGRCPGSNAPTEPISGASQNALTRKAGGRKAPEKQIQVIVDMREFRSSLPSVLHQQGMKIIPVTLEVGDYILSPDICVERKSIADLISSFSSGRLYHQAETMTRYYRIPVLLIEFSQDKSFYFQSANDIGEDISPFNIISKLSLLVLHFPRLRLVWSRSLHATAEIFASLKANQDEPDVSTAMRVGVPTEDGLIEGDIRAENYNTTAVEFLRRLPGVTDANYRSLMDGCKSLAELALLPLERLAELMGGQRPARMLRDFLDAKCPSLL